jgi:hypothetical protein
MTQTIGDRPSPPPPPAARAAAPAKNAPAGGANLPSLAQFALNQTLNRLAAAAPPEEGAAAPAPRALSIFRDSDSGQLVTLFRDSASGETEQIPEERVLAFYARLAQEMTERLAGPPQDSVDVNA